MDTKKAGFFAAVIVPALVTLGLLSSAGPNQAADSDSQKRAAESGAQLWARLADRTSEALEAISEAEALAERYEQGVYCSQLHRLRGVFLTAMGAEDARIEASFCEAIRIAKEQKSVSLEKRAEATYAEYRSQKGSGGRGFRLPLW